VYWETDVQFGGAFGFASEVSPGFAVPPLESLETMLTPAHLWPIDNVWSLHAGLNQYADLGAFTEAMNHRYGAATSADDYSRKAQLLAYESHRAMFEAYSRHKYEKTTGVVQWMLNNAWPSNLWHLYDYNLRPGGAYFGAKRALEPLHVQYSYADQAVTVVNSQLQAFGGLRVTAQSYRLDGSAMDSKTTTVNVGNDAVVTAFTFPTPAGATTTWVLRLTLTDDAEKVLSRNDYWLSLAPDQLDFPNTTIARTPQSAWADFTSLQQLAPANLPTIGFSLQQGEENVDQITVGNMGTSAAFGVQLQLFAGASGPEVLPIRCDDGWFLLFPGDSRVVTCRYRSALLGGAMPVYEARAFNR
jgi:exo-1,4-beta-D-glucosaminidase